MEDQTINKENLENQDSLQACKNELQQAKDMFLRLNADFENYKKRINKEKSDWVISSQANILIEILNIVDDFDRAFQEYNKEGNKEKSQTWIQGFELIHKSLYKLLEKYEIQEIKENKNFDPELHEAIAQVDSEQNKSGEIINVVQKGYMFKDKILRPAKVIVAK